MIGYWCGFNGFNQIQPKERKTLAISQFQRIFLKGIKDIGLTWSHVVVLAEEDVYVSGFCGNHFNSLQKLTKPDTVLQFLTVACNETCALFTSESGECWQYFYHSEQWKKLLNFTIIEGNQNTSSYEYSQALKVNVNSSEEYVDNSEKRIIKICCGEVVNIALDNCGQIYSIPSPIPLPGIQITDVACGFEHCLMLDDFQRVYSWGSGMRGQLGCEILETVDSPQEIEALSGLNVIKIAAGGWHCAAVTSIGVLYTWGWNNCGQLGFSAVESFESSASYSVNENIDFVSNMSSYSKKCDNKSKEQNQDSKEHFEQVVQENEDVHKNKKIKYTEYEELNENAQCSESREMKVDKTSLKEGHIDLADSPAEEKEYVTVLAIPRAVDFPTRSDVNIIDVSCGNRHTIALADNGVVWGCGWNAYGQLGKSPNEVIKVDSMTKIDIPGEEGISSIHCGGWNTVILYKH